MPRPARQGRAPHHRVRCLQHGRPESMRGEKHCHEFPFEAVQAVERLACYTVLSLSSLLMRACVPS
eukprot:scaffold78835_cov19-Tisochrysis_lutea.AAC.2